MNLAVEAETITAVRVWRQFSQAFDFIRDRPRDEVDWIMDATPKVIASLRAAHRDEMADGLVRDWIRTRRWIEDAAA